MKKLINAREYLKQYRKVRHVSWFSVFLYVAGV